PVIPLTIAQRKQLRAALLNDMIDDRLVKQFLAKNGPKVDPAELEAQMKAFAAQLVKENQTLAEYLKKAGQTEAQLRADWTAAIQLSNYVQQQATDDQLRAYHAANRDHFDKVEVRVSHIIIRVSKGALPGERATAKEKMQAIRADLAVGKIDFATAARKFSQEPTARTGGDLGFILRRGQEELEEPLVKAAFAMKVGGISEVLETSSGIHLIAVTDRKPGMPTMIEKCAGEVLEAFIEDYRTELIARLRKEGQIRISLP
ncbi:MAG TPA: peptidylprolyl isomerase, partial [Gemmata sp.]|nr:peptidylprolyl isomerase [Gemmata sp.]